MRPWASCSRLNTLARSTSLTPAATAWATAMPPWYWASMGQTGWQLLLPQQGGRPSNVRLLRATVLATTG
ncbi:hypothetical protein D3C78_1376170 [compost metagenome]